MTTKINGTALGSMVVGSLLLYSGVTGRDILKSVQAIISGKSPSTAPQAYGISGQDTTVIAATGANAVGPTSGGGSRSKNIALAMQIATAMGHADWTTGKQKSDWIALWDGESGWRADADNPGSDAYGIPQALPGSKMASAGADWKTNPATQIRWGIGYIAGRPDYGSPSAAYAKWLARSPHWY